MHFLAAKKRYVLGDSQFCLCGVPCALPSPFQNTSVMCVLFCKGIIIRPLFQYSLCLLILFLVEMGGAVCGFAFPRSLHGLLELSFTERVLHAYRDDPDLQNFIDFAQSDVSATTSLYEVCMVSK